MSSCISLRYQTTGSLKQYFQEQSWSLKLEQFLQCKTCSSDLKEVTLTVNYQLFASKTYLFDLKLNYQNKNLDRGFASILPTVSKLPILLFCISLLSSETEVLICISHLMLAVEKRSCINVFPTQCYIFWSYCGRLRESSARDVNIYKNLQF